MHDPEREQLVQRITKLEEVLSHQEHTIQQFHQVLLQLGSELESIGTRYETKFNKLQEEIDRLAEPGDPNEKPPHY